MITGPQEFCDYVNTRLSSNLKFRPYIDITGERHSEFLSTDHPKIDVVTYGISPRFAWPEYYLSEEMDNEWKWFIHYELHRLLTFKCSSVWEGSDILAERTATGLSAAANKLIVSLKPPVFLRKPFELRYREVFESISTEFVCTGRYGTLENPE